MPLSSTLRSLVTWRNAAILLTLLNLKSVPFAWHIRLLYQMAKHRLDPRNVKKIIEETVRNGSIHPIFDSVSIYTHSPMYECDYNFHKSNSTFFGDLDESRTALMTKLCLPAMNTGLKELEKEGKKGNFNIILGAVHTSFHKEIVPYERYEVRSRILGWDQKWCVIGSFFIRPAKGGRDEELLASSLSKYVVKKGRFTVMPERWMTAAGWLPKKPEDCQAGPQTHSQGSSEESTETVIPATDRSLQSSTEDQAVSGDDNKSIAAPVPEATIKTGNVVEKLEQVASRIAGDSSTEAIISALTSLRATEWDWHRIDMERLRGLRIVNAWLSLDKDLMKEYAPSQTGN